MDLIHRLEDIDRELGGQGAMDCLPPMPAPSKRFKHPYAEPAYLLNPKC